MSSEDRHKENLELLKGLNVPKKVRDKMPEGLHVGCNLPFHAITCKDWKPEETRYLDNDDVYCPFSGDGKCPGGCTSNRERACILGEE